MAPKTVELYVVFGRTLNKIRKTLSPFNLVSDTVERTIVMITWQVNLIECFLEQGGGGGWQVF